MLNGSFFLPRNQRKVPLKSSLFLVQSNANAPACEVIENGAKVCLVKYQLVIIEFCVT